MSAAVYAARAKLDTVVLDKNPSAGALGTASRIENYPGVLQSMAGKELLSLFRQQAERFGAKVVQTQALGVLLDQEPKQVIAADGRYLGKTVIIATGAMGRKPTIEGEAQLVGRGVSYCAACDAAFFAEEDVAMVGNFGGIAEELDSVARFARKVYAIVYGRSPNSELDEKLQDMPNLELIRGQRVSRILGDNAVEGLVLSDSGGTERVVDVTGVFVYLHGAQPIVDFLSDAIEMVEGCIKVDKDDMSTSVDGVYAVGDVTCKKIRQTVIAAAEGCIAALSADKFINDRKAARSQWSSAT
jgi:thioredoxin reductase (NADPH)